MDKRNSKTVGNLSKFFYGVILLSILLTFSSVNGQSELSLQERISQTPAGGVIEPIHAPFSMPQLKRPVFADRIFSIADYGAKSGGEIKNTKAFAKAIKACNKAGGGKVVVPAGKWLTGPIHLKSNVHLYLSEGSEIIFSDRFEDYLPVVFTRWEGVECYNYSPFIYARDCENIAITGPGVLNGNGERWWSWHKRQGNSVLRLLTAEADGVPVKERVFGTVDAALRPAFIQPVNCKNVWMEGFTLKKGAFWSVQMIYCENAIVRKLAIHTQGYPNGDGVNSDSSRNILIEYCYFDADDDAVAIKSGKNEDAWRVGKPSENIVVRHCYSKGPRWGSISIGSEMSGGVRNVYIHDVEFDGTLLGFQIKTKPGRGSMVENVWLENVVARGLHYPVFFLNTAYSADTFTPSVLAMPKLRNIYARNVRSTHAANSNMAPILINGLEEVFAENIHLEDFTCQSNRGPNINFTRQIELKNVHITVKKGPAITMNNCQDVTLSNSAADKPCDVFLRVEGENSGNIHLKGNDLQNADKAVQLGEKVPAGAVVSKAIQIPEDRRLGEPLTLESVFPMQPVADIDSWPARRNEIRTRILVAAGLHPMPKRSPLNPIIHGKVEREDYTVERVIFESFPGHYVTGSLYRPKTPVRGKRPAVLSPHGHWEQGRFTDLGIDVAKEKIESGGERIENNARHHLQARCVQLARMGCVVFFYDMEGYADNMQIVDHWMGPRPGDPDKAGYLLFSPEAELQGQTLFGLQTWNSIRAVDFVSSLPDVDPDRIGVTGASGGGTQSMIIGAVDDRIAASMPVAMVSAAMQGGSVCENAQYLRINQGNIDIIAVTAPRPLCLIAADDWTIELETKGHPDLKGLYQMLGQPDNYEAHFHLEFPHNYNSVNRHHMYSFMNRHLKLGASEPIVERPFVPLDIETEATVWTDEHPKPAGNQVGQPHERELTTRWTEATKTAMAEMKKDDRYRLVAEGLTTMVGRSASEVGHVQWEPSGKVVANEYFLLTGRLTVTEHGEQLPAMFVYPKKDRNFQTVIWLSDTGKDSMLGPDGDLIPAVSTLVGRGYCVASIDMFGQGEFLGASDDKAVESVRIIPRGKGEELYHKAACFHFGYNSPLLIQRVHDVMSLVEFLAGGVDDFKTKGISLVALGQQAGPVGLTARFMLGDRIDKAAIDTEDFYFKSVDRFDQPMFLPGILRYGGIDAMWQINRPYKTIDVKGADAALDVL